MSDEGGVWRTVGGRRVFIKDGEDLKMAMKNSGKFKNSTEKSVGSLNRIDNLAEEAQHYINGYDKEGLEKKGRELGAKDFEEYINKYKKESWSKRNNYAKGDVIEYDTNHNGVNPHWHQGEIISVEKGLAGHGDTNPDNVYKVRDIQTKNEYSVDASGVTKRIKRG